MASVQIFIGLLLTLLVVSDVFVTVFSTNGAGPLTGRWTAMFWRLVMVLHRRRPVHRALSFIGPFLLIATVCLWYVMLNVSLVLLLSSELGAAKHSTDGSPLTLTETVYFVGATLSTVGYGDLLPSGSPWTFVSNLYAFLTTIILTSALSFLISVVRAAVERKAVAQSIFGLGHTPSALVDCVRLHEDQALVPQLVTICGQLDSCAFQHLAYPILTYFHSPIWSRSPARAVLALADAHFIYAHVLPEVHRPSPGLLHLIDSSIITYADVAATRTTSISEDDEPSTGELIDAVEDLDIPKRPRQAWDDELEEYGKRRRWLLAMCDEDGWGDKHFRRARRPADEEASG